MGYLVLQGGNEFNGLMAKVDRRALELAGNQDAVVSIIAAAAAPDCNHERAGRNAVQWFGSLGAIQVTVAPVIDRRSAQNQQTASILARSTFIYVLGGFPGYLAQTLVGSHSWRAVEQAYATGAVVAGSSAGAMVMGEWFYDPLTDQMTKGLGLLPGVGVLPHHNRLGPARAFALRKKLPPIPLLGIDEETGAISDADKTLWTVYGRGVVTRYHGDGVSRFTEGMTFSLADIERSA